MINYYKQIISLVFVVISTSVLSQNEFITHWSAPMDTLITIKTKASSGPYNYTVSWQSLSTPSFTGSVNNQTGDYVILNVPNGDTIEVKISGVFPHFHMRYGDQRNFLTKVVQWGNIQWGNMSWAFEGCEKMILTATDSPDLSLVTSMEGMFAGCKLFNQSINSWDVSNVTDMRDLFASDSLFDKPLDNWDVSNVTTMENMFSGARNFNQPIDNWNVSNVTNMKMMFALTKHFNQPLNSWDVFAVTNMYGMFNGAEVFNQPLDDWNVSNVTNMSQMFLNSPIFNQPINTWVVSNVTRTNEMFKNAISFKETLEDWDVSSVLYMYEMFSGAISFNKPVNDWDVSNVISMNKMFFGASYFNQALNNWDISSVTDMTDMLSGATELSYCHYDDALIAWKALPVVPTNITLGAVGIKYSMKAQNARNLLGVFHNWTITDNGIETDAIVVDLTTSNNSFCVGNSTVLNATSTFPGTFFTWNENLSPLNQHTVNPMVTTEYIVTGADVYGCKDSDTLEVVVIQLPNIVLQASQLEICVGDTVTLTASGGDVYSWNLILGSAPSNELTPVLTTEYIVVGENASGCISSDTLSVVVNDLPSVDLQANELTICEGGTVNLTASGAQTYSWNQGLSAGATKNVSPTSSTEYIVLGTDVNGCESTDSIFITVEECLSTTALDTDLIKIYPNPASELVIIQGEGLTSAFQWIHVLDITGKLAMTLKISQYEETIPVAELTDGIYFINLVGSQNKTFKIEVKR